MTPRCFSRQKNGEMPILAKVGESGLGAKKFWRAVKVATISAKIGIGAYFGSGNDLIRVVFSKFQPRVFCLIF